jgi:hypothetical protein
LSFPSFSDNHVVAIGNGARSGLGAFVEFGRRFEVGLLEGIIVEERADRR